MEAYHSLWIRMPAYVVGIFVFGRICLYGLGLMMQTIRGSKSVLITIKFLSIYGFLMVCVPAYFGAWNEEDIWATFIEAFLANFLYLLMLSTVIGSGFVGYSTYQKSGSKILAWAIAIFMMACLVLLINWMAEQIPGVDWRFNEIFERDDSGNSYY